MKQASGPSLVALAIVVSALLACGGSPISSRRVTGPDGRLAAAISCKGEALLCYSEAGRLCPHGYEMLESKQYKTAHDMLVRCRGPKKKTRKK